MDTVLDRYGNKLQVTGYCYPAFIWTLSDEDNPVACYAVSRVNGVGVQWEDEEYADYHLSDYLHKTQGVGDVVIKGKTFNFSNERANYFVGMSDGKAIVCTAITDNGSMFCQWRKSSIRNSLTAFAWASRVYSTVLESKYLSKGITKLYGITRVENIASNSYLLKAGAVMVERIDVGGRLFNKYEHDIFDIIQRVNALRAVWEDNNIGDFDNPSMLVQEEQVAYV